MNTGEKIKLARKRAGLTQKELGEKLGITYQQIGQYENGKRQPKLETLNKIADALDADVWNLYDGYTLKPALPNEHFWTAYLDEKLKQLGCSIGYNEEDAFLWINYPDGTLEVTEENLKDLDKSTLSYLKFKLEELKQEHIEDFRPKK
ncbi:MAG: helix-turn-helix transcriptional regulator [Dorea sp.]|nr:helix-turn-helix transcriptional regulator [Dorea sp.]